MSTLKPRRYVVPLLLGALLSCLSGASAAAATVLPSGFSEVIVASGLTAPTAMAFAPDGRLFVCLQSGQVRIIKNGVLLPTPFLSLTVNAVGERGLLGIAFDPAFTTNHYVYLYYTAATPDIHNRVSRVTETGDVAAPGSEVALIDLNVEPLSGASNHNGGAIHFGLDGKLYVAVGDNAIPSNSQTLANRLGKLLRINSDGTIPSDNPFFDTASGLNRAIWTLGLRNPFTFAVQPGSGRLFINDVGASAWEEVNDGVAGANYGWPQCEGPNQFGTETPCDPAFAAPIFAYDRRGTGECAIAGGAFYNPTAVQFPSEYVGGYFFGDLCGNSIRRREASGTVSPFATGAVGPVDLQVSSDGSLYYLSRGGGYVARINYAPPGTPRPGARADFDGNGADDLAVYRRSTGTWHVRNQFEIAFGDAGDVPVPGDYDGNGVTEIAVFRPLTGQWFVRGVPAVQFGQAGDVPVPRDYDGDGTTDIAVYRPSNGTWYVRNQFTIQFGDPGDIPVPGYYFGDGAARLAVYRPATGMWYVFGAGGIGRTVQLGELGDVPVPADYDGDRTDDFAVYRPTTGFWVVDSRFGDFALPFGSPGDVPVPRDYDGDGAADVAVYRAATGQWFVRSQFVIQFGGGSDIPVPRGPLPLVATPGDYGGDRVTDLAVYRPSTGTWFVRNTSAVQFGDAGDTPVPADYDGDGVIDIAVYRPSTRVWFARNQFALQFGDAGDVPVPGDYNGDGVMDIAVYRPSTGVWFVRDQFTVQFGDSGDVPVPADYDGNGVTDLALYRPSTGRWFVRNQVTVQFGDTGDVPVPADYNGDGLTDFAVYRPSTGTWYVRNQLAVMFGNSSDKPIPGDFNADGVADIAVYRPSSGVWYVRNQLATQFGDPGDLPVVRIGPPQ